MSKADKMTSATKKTGKLGTEKEDEPDYLETIAKDPDFHLGTGNFDFPNGDSYEGEFCAHSSGVVWRQGKGKYTSKDGQIYVGEWDGDALLENKDVEITYKDGSKYYGALLQSQYTGPGVYQLQENLALTCTFAENKPTGEITLVDPNLKMWYGFAEKDESLFVQEHPFYGSIGKDLGKGKCKNPPPKDSKLSLKKSLSVKSVPSKTFIAFEKSKKTPSDLDFNESSWYKDYVEYCDKFEDIVHKARTNGETTLKEEEYQWYKNYKEFEKKYNLLLKEHKFPLTKKLQANTDLFQLIHSEEYKKANTPIKVIYPTIINK
ncbi:unnamed protein product [Ceutorhynchus assimilis]|uniref:Uncharacterized protein n=1 Tax=Ceutorhynchus assimilis TaxID=467358 RepID=A0A9N9N063_9CUCU|nr:unnamed protein product [Ceutorhynchus assimilis]